MKSSSNPLLTLIFEGFEKTEGESWWYSAGVDRVYQYRLSPASGCLFFGYLDTEEFGVNSVGVDREGKEDRVQIYVFGAESEAGSGRATIVLKCSGVMLEVFRADSELDMDGEETLFYGDGDKKITAIIDPDGM